MAAHDRASARVREGVVVSVAMDKTIVVVVRRRIRHRQYRKYVNVNKKFLAHDESNECSLGDRVVIAETRPVSKNKRWRLRTIVEKAVADVAVIDELEEAEKAAEAEDAR